MSESAIYDEKELGERLALLKVRSFIIKHGVKEVDAYCQQRLHDLRMDALHRKNEENRSKAAAQP